MHETQEGPQKHSLGQTRMRLASKLMSMGSFLLGARVKQSMEDLVINGRSGGGLRWLTLKVG